MKYNEHRPLLIALAAVVVVVLGFVTAVALHETDVVPIRYGADVTNPTYGLNIQTYTGTYDADTQYLGKCAVVTPPNADPCDAVQGTLRYAFFNSLVNADQFIKWKKYAPLDYNRLTAHMNAPACSNGTGLVQDMKTFMGAALFSVVQAYACALGVEPIAWPAPNPPRAAGATDKTAPSAPGPITVTPNP